MFFVHVTYKLNINFINLYEASGVICLVIFAGIFFSLTHLLINQFYFILGDKSSGIIPPFLHLLSLLRIFFFYAFPILSQVLAF